MENNNSLTYILGAGASFQSIPVVDTFAGRFDEFIQSVDGFANNYKSDVKNQGLLYRLKDLSKTLLKEFQEHQSFDTFFKKLFHIEDYTTIRLYKKILNLYFIWEHTSSSIVIQNKINVAHFFKQASIDKRYDALIGGLLQPIRREKKLFCKTNFITWNYDLNLLSSIKNYFFPEMAFGQLIDKLDYSKNEWIINDQITILNMNGIFYSSEFDQFSKLPRSNSYNLFENKLKENYFDDNFKDDDAESIRFAWELKDSTDIINCASKLISQSKNIVIIGYTFPLYNRIIDSKYLTHTTLSKQSVIIQDPNANELTSDFYEYFGRENLINKIKIKTGCNSFHVPKDIFVM